MAGQEQEGPKPTELDLLVDRTADLFRTHDPIFNPETGEPYILPMAAREIIDETVSSGRQPGELVVELAKLTNVPPGVITAWTDFSESEGQWDRFFSQVARGIVGEEAARRLPELRDESNRRANSWE